MQKILSYLIISLSLCLIILTVMAYTLSGPALYNLLSENITLIVVLFYCISLIGYILILIFSGLHRTNMKRCF